MGEIKRDAFCTEVLTLSRCPCCDGDVSAGDRGYSSFNPGWAKCNGECKREWKLGFVNDAWDAGKTWNELAESISSKLRAFSLLKVDRALTLHGNVDSEDLDDDAAALLAELIRVIVGAKEQAK